MKYENIDWARAQMNLEKQQRELVEVYKENGLSETTFQQQSKIINGFHTRALAIRRVISNKGGQTAGVDGALWKTNEDKSKALLILKGYIESPKTYKCRPVKRVWIPKPGKTEKRPLGIPTLEDRAMQYIYLQAMDPIVEEDSDKNSYAFRKYRAPRDAIAKIRHLLFQDHGPKWVIDADIEKCFDKIDHEFLLKTVPLKDNSIILKWLKSGSINYKEGFLSTESGTPQGSIISPMLCNMALNGMEKYIEKYVSQNHKRRKEKVSAKVHLIRYADDIIITSVSEALAYNLKKVLNDFLQGRGLNTHENKTRITTFEKGITFLGFDIFTRPYSSKLNKSNKQSTRVIIVPNKEKIKNFLKKVKAEFKPQSHFLSIVLKVNPIIQGWSNYYKITYHSVRQMDWIQTQLWRYAFKWGCRRHSKKKVQWIFDRYMKDSGARTKQWYAIADGKQRNEYFLYNPSVGKETKIWHPKSGMNPYTEEGKEYFESRALNIRLSPKEQTLRERLLRRWNGQCAFCSKALYQELDLQGPDSIEIHHITPLKKGGTWILNNLQPLHRTCHLVVTQKGGGNATLL
jgi:RNA-directed DNA polymerase